MPFAITYFYIWADNSNSTADNPNGTRSAPDLYTARVTVSNPTAATGSLSGRVSAADGNGIRNVAVQLTDAATNEIRNARTNSFGYYSFEDLPVGETYFLTVKAKRFTFAEPTRVLNLTGNLSDINFIGLEQ